MNKRAMLSNTRPNTINAKAACECQIQAPVRNIPPQVAPMVPHNDVLGGLTHVSVMRMDITKQARALIKHNTTGHLTHWV